MYDSDEDPERKRRYELEKKWRNDEFYESSSHYSSSSQNTNRSRTSIDQFDMLMNDFANNDFECADYFIDLYDVTKIDSNGNTILHYTAKYGSSSTVSKLLQSFTFYAIVDELNNDGKTPLMLAVEYDMLGVMMMLLNDDSNINIVNSDGHNALTIAAMFDRKVLFNILLEHHMYLNIKFDLPEGIDIKQEYLDAMRPLLN